MPTGKSKSGKDGGAGSRANRYKQMLLDQGVDPKAARAMTRDRYEDLSPYERKTARGTTVKIPITSSEIVEMEKIAERQAKEYKSSGKYVSPEKRKEFVDPIRGRYTGVSPEMEYEYKKKQMTPSRTLESSGTVRPVGGEKPMTPSRTLEASGTVRPVGGGGMNPVDIEKVPGKRPLKMSTGGLATRGYGIAKRPAKKVIKKAR